MGALIAALLVSAVQAQWCGNILEHSVGTCRFANCNPSRGSTYCTLVSHRCFCSDGWCPMSSSTGGAGESWCANQLVGHSCRIDACSPAHSICYRHGCYCGYGYKTNDNNHCVRDYTWPISLEEFRAMNATAAEIQ